MHYIHVYKNKSNVEIYIPCPPDPELVASLLGACDPEGPGRCNWPVSDWVTDTGCPPGGDPIGGRTEGEAPATSVRTLIAS